MTIKYEDLIDQFDRAHASKAAQRIIEIISEGQWDEEQVRECWDDQTRLMGIHVKNLTWIYVQEMRDE